MKGRQQPKREFFECQHCGADVPVGARSCKECGSDAATGWQGGEELDYQSLDLPEGYASLPDHPGGPVPGARRRWIALVAVLLAALLLAMATGLLFR